MERTLFLWSLLVPVVVWASSLEYGGINSSTTLRSLKDRYSDTIFSNGYGHLNEKDVHDHIHFIAIRQRGERIVVRVSFERPNTPGQTPADWRENHYARHPKCNVILSKLRETHGAGKQTVEVWEERLEWKSYQWDKNNDHMLFRCYRPDGKGEFLAAEIDFWKNGPCLLSQ